MKANNMPLPTYYLPTYYLPTYYLPLTTYHLPLTTYHLALISHKFIIFESENKKKQIVAILRLIKLNKTNN